MRNTKTLFCSQEVSLVVDSCRNAIVDENLQHSTLDTTMCKTAGHLPGDDFVLDVLTPLEIGGRFASNINYPPDINGAGFDGCIKNVRVNGQVGR